MIFFPNSKINIGLHICKKRADGFHSIDTLFYPTHLCDILEIISQEDLATGAKQKDELCLSGRPINCSMENNLVMRALYLLREELSKNISPKKQIPAVKIFLHKIIPDGAGLGGGSADAAFCLKGLNTKFELGLDHSQLEGICRKLGSDCAFFIENKAVLGLEKGDVFEEAPMQCLEILKNYTPILRFPPVSISTQEAYSEIVPQAHRPPLSELLQYPIQEWK
ncbi:MAG: 4-(cytidine 5'-diphospho)-2-C-methyl-D-erythritol kinase, partial [Bacteroidales bacterium]